MCTITSWMTPFPYIFMISGMAIFAYILLAILFAGYVRVAYDRDAQMRQLGYPMAVLHNASASVYRDVSRSADACFD